MEKIINRIRESFELKKVTGYKVSRATSLTEFGVNKILNGTSKRPHKSTIDIIHNYLCSSYGFNLKWLLTGEGDVFTPKELSKEIKSDLKERIEILEDTVRLQDKKIEALRKFKDSQGDLLIGVEFYKNEVLELKELIHRKIGLRLDGSQKG